MASSSGLDAIAPRCNPEDSEMPSLTIRIRDDFDRIAIERLRAVTHEATSSKALLKAAYQLPNNLQELRTARSRIAELESTLERLVLAERDVAVARERLDRRARLRLP